MTVQKYREGVIRVVFHQGMPIQHCHDIIAALGGTVEYWTADWPDMFDVRMARQYEDAMVEVFSQDGHVARAERIPERP